ncbi:MAG TPA: hypothetical protein VGG49_02400 [Steroidobacteraceae bacterium]|jgi:hypothetical protein
MNACIAQEIEPALDQLTHGVRLLPSFTVEQIASLCQHLSTPEREVYARIESVQGKPVAYLVRGAPSDSIPPFLRRQAD